MELLIFQYRLASSDESEAQRQTREWMNSDQERPREDVCTLGERSRRGDHEKSCMIIKFAPWSSIRPPKCQSCKLKTGKVSDDI